MILNTPHPVWNIICYFEAVSAWLVKHTICPTLQPITKSDRWQAVKQDDFVPWALLSVVPDSGCVRVLVGPQKISAVKFSQISRFNSILRFTLGGKSSSFSNYVKDAELHFLDFQLLSNNDVLSGRPLSKAVFWLHTFGFWSSGCRCKLVFHPFFLTDGWGVHSFNLSIYVMLCDPCQSWYHTFILDTVN